MSNLSYDIILAEMGNSIIHVISSRIKDNYMQINYCLQHLYGHENEIEEAGQDQLVDSDNKLHISRWFSWPLILHKLHKMYTNWELKEGIKY